MNLVKHTGIIYILSRMKWKLLYFHLLAAVILTSCRQPQVRDAIKLNRLPDIFPDYTEVTIPYNIAPLNFRLNDSCATIAVVVEGRDEKLESSNDGNKIYFDLKKWAELLEHHKGQQLQLTVFAQNNGQWHQYKPFVITVSNEPVDGYLVYRLILPGFQSWNEMGIYQRSLCTFSQEPILNSKLMPGTCMNCHSFAQNDPDNMVLHLREFNGGTILIQDGKIDRLHTKTEEMFASAAFPYWHPSRKYIAFSIDNVRQIFHSIGPHRAHVIDLKSDMVVYDIVKNEMITSSLLFSENAFETFPCFSPDGKTLFFCSSKPGKLPVDYAKMKYSLCSISFDPETGTFGDRVDTLISAAKINKSISIPRVSSDGRFIMFNLFNYGNFPSYNPESDLYLYDLLGEKYRPLTRLNSNNVESYHSWSSNGRWTVFSTRRVDGLYSTPFIAYMDEDGNPGKPFLLPQEDPDFYQNFLYSFNLPEFVIDKVKVDPYKLEDVAKNSPGKQVLFRGIQQAKNE